MKFEPKLSIIFLCHNNEHINIALDSVIEQIDCNDEIIIVDDHSNESTLCILERYSHMPQIHLTKSPKIANRSYNRNLGAQLATNPILVFLDGDMVLGNQGVIELKNAHYFREEKAFIGQKHGIHYDSIQMQLYSSIPNYIDLLRTKEGRNQLEKNPLFVDNRSKYFDDPSTEDYRWVYYYTGLCSVEKVIFERAGGFDENFCSWGSEDIDLGYRISKICKIGFINKMHGFHIPHIRDVANNELSNMRNTAYMLQKYNTWEFEVLQNFYGYGSLSSFEKVLNRMRLIKVSNEHPPLKNREIVIDIISQQNPLGKIIYKKIEIEKANSYWGIVVPFDDFYFETAYISDHVFIYPHLITSRILQEALRISKRVLIFPTSDSIRIPWDAEKVLLPKAPKQHIYYEANDLLAFTFLPVENNFLEVTFIKCIKDAAFL